jgi:hypothetical protein
MYAAPTRTTTLAFTFMLLGLLALAVTLPHGRMAPNGHMEFDPATREHTWVHDEARMALHAGANAAGGYAVILTLLSMAIPYLKRPKLQKWHGRVGVLVLVLAGLHTFLYLAEGSLRGWLPGMLSFLAFGLHGITGALKVHFLRTWGPAWWRFVHRGSAWAALALVAEHILVASWHFGLARWFEEGGW